MASFHCQDLTGTSHCVEAGKGAIVGTMKDDSVQPPMQGQGQKVREQSPAPSVPVSLFPSPLVLSNKMKAQSSLLSNPEMCSVYSHPSCPATRSLSLSCSHFEALWGREETSCVHLSVLWYPKVLGEGCGMRACGGCRSDNVFCFLYPGSHTVPHPWGKAGLSPSDVSALGFLWGAREGS